MVRLEKKHSSRRTKKNFQPLRRLPTPGCPFHVEANPPTTSPLIFGKTSQDEDGQPKIPAKCHPKSSTFNLRFGVLASKRFKMRMGN